MEIKNDTHGLAKGGQDTAIFIIQAVQKNKIHKMWNDTSLISM